MQPDITLRSSILSFKKLSLFLSMTIAILIGSAITEYGLFWLTLQYEVYPEQVSWYFPAAFRILLFLFLPFRYWVAAFIGVNLGNAEFYVGYLSSPMGLSYHLSQFPSYLATMPVIALVKYQNWHRNLLSLRTIVTLIGLIVVCRFITTTYAYLAAQHMYEDISRDEQFEMYFAHQLSAYISGLALLNGFYIAAWIGKNKSNLITRENAHLLTMLLSLTCLINAVFYLQPSSAYLMKMFAFVPIIWFAMRFGFIGIITSVGCISGIIFTHLFSIGNGTLLLEYQPFLMAYFLVCFLVGGVMLEHDKATLFLSNANATLLNQNSELVETNHKISDLAKRITTLQEREKKALSQELHDELGQNITALNTQLSIIERKHLVTPVATINTQALHDNAHDMLTNVSGLTDWLTHDELTHNGIVSTLSGTHFRTLLDNANIDYHLSLSGQLDTLPKQYQIMLFRIVQEAVNNTIKYSNSDCFSLELHYTETELNLSLHDNGIGFDIETINDPTSFGLDGIRNRVMALGGQVTMENNNGATIRAVFARHQIK